MKLPVLWLAFFAAAMNVSAQASPEPVIRLLTIGDTVPDIELPNLINHHSKTARLSDFKGKLVILDFWATWCGPCVAALPKMNALQKEFEGKIKIVAVTTENRQKVLDFLQKYKAAPEISSLLLQTDDSLMSIMFPHKSVPHTVWIGSDRQVKAITGGEYVISKNIKNILENESVSWRVKDESSVFPFKDAGIFDLSNLANTKLNLHSGFTGYIEGVSPGLFINHDTTHNLLRYNQYNLSILSLYAIGYGHFPEFQNPKRCVFSVQDLSKYVYNQRKEYYEIWSRRNWYCYEAVAPVAYPEVYLRERLVRDLDFFFKINSKKETRKVSCLILKKLDNSKLMAAKGGIPQRKISLLEAGKYQYTHRNNRISEFIFTMNTDIGLNLLPLMIDETGYKEAIDLELMIDVKMPVSVLRTALRKYGLDLVSEDRELEMLIIKEK